VHAEIFVLDHHAPGLRQGPGREERLLRRLSPARSALPALGSSAFGAMVRQSDRADVDAGVALDAELVGEDRLDVAVQAALDLARRLLGREAELDLERSSSSKPLDEIDVLIFWRPTGL
jgi:hypothetical protein